MGVVSNGSTWHVKPAICHSRGGLDETPAPRRRIRESPDDRPTTRSYILSRTSVTVIRNLARKGGTIVRGFFRLNLQALYGVLQVDR